MEMTRQQQKLNELTDRLQEGVENVFESDKYAEYLRVMSRFHNYSYRNSLLIAMQNPNATMVAGYLSWKKNFGRQVKKGEKAIQILSPAPYRKKEKMEVLDQETQLPVRNPDGSTMTEEVEVMIPAFRAASVFDISQTSGKPLPSLFGDIEGDVKEFENFMDAMRTVSPVPIEYAPMDDKDGYYHQVEKKIYLRDDMSQRQTVAAVIHEVSHAKLHDLDVNNLRESLQALGKDRSTREVEAESIAYVVSQKYGIDTGNNSFGYIASWSKNKKLPELQASLQVIRDTAAELIDGIDGRLEELHREQENMREISQSDIILRISGPAEQEYSYSIVENISREALIELLRQHWQDRLEMPQSKNVFEDQVKEYLEEKGAKLVFWERSGEENERKAVTFFDVEYDKEKGISAMDELPSVRQAEMMIDRTEYNHSCFSPEERELILSYSNKTDNPDKTRFLIENMADAMEELDSAELREIVETAEKEIKAFPDESIGLSDMHAYGCTAENMLPVTLQRAQELFETGERIYCLYQDGSSVRASNRDEISAHEGIFGVNKEDWDKFLRREELYSHPDLIELLGGRPSPAMLPLEKGRALEVMEGGYSVYSITPDSPILKVKREEIEQGSQYYQIPDYELEDYLNYERLVDQRLEISTVKEAKLLFGKEKGYGIYQINEEGAGRPYIFMNLSNVERHEYRIKKEDYQIIYTGTWGTEETLDSLYEKFNINHPGDFAGHSLSVSDIVVVNNGMDVNAYYVDSFGFPELPDFLQNVLKAKEAVKEAAFRISDRYITVQETEGGYDYSVYDEAYKLLDGGVYENNELSVYQVAEDIARDLAEPFFNTATEQYERLKLQGNVAVGDRLIRIPEESIYEKIEMANSISGQENNPLKNAEEQEHAYLDYYAAECDEFHNMGKYYDGLTLDEAVEKYREILNDPRLSYMGNALGVVYHDPDDSLFTGSECALVQGDVICGDKIDMVPVFSNNPKISAEVKETLERLQENFPGFAYRSPQKVVNYYPEKMDENQLAEAMNELVRAFDNYDYNGRVDDLKTAIEEIKYALLTGDAEPFVEYLKEIMDEDTGELAARSRELLGKTENFLSAEGKTIEPIVKIHFSEMEELTGRKYLPIRELDNQIRILDRKAANIKNPDTGEPKQTYRLQFTIFYAAQGKIQKLDGSMNIGDGDGGLIESLKVQVKLKLTDDVWLAYNRSRGETVFNEYIAELTDQQEHILPYLQSFCSIQERQPEKTAAVEKRTTVAKKESPVQKTKTKQAVSQNSKKQPSIHERLQRNKEMIAAQMGSAQNRKGLELV